MQKILTLPVYNSVHILLIDCWYLFFKKFSPTYEQFY